MAKSTTQGHELGRGARARIEQACTQAVAGKLAVRQLTCWLAGSGVCESEFRVLWHLQAVADATAATPTSSPVALPNGRLDQADLAERLAASPAQISAVVDRLRRRGLAVCESHPADRRRQLWRLTPEGRALVFEVVAAVDAPSTDSAKKEAA